MGLIEQEELIALYCSIVLKALEARYSELEQNWIFILGLVNFSSNAYISQALTQNPMKARQHFIYKS